MITKINGTISFEGSATFTKNGRTDECDMLTFKYWAKNGKERIYINDYKRRTIGYIDVTTGEVVINDKQGNYESEIEMAIEGFVAEYVTVETVETVETETVETETETGEAQGEEQMTREQKIKNILEAYTAVIEEEVKNGTLTSDKCVAIMASQNAAILAVDECANK